MKKLEGMMPPTVVLAEEGKNGDCGPPPSSVIARGALSGFRMRSSDEGKLFRYIANDAGSTRRTRKRIAVHFLKFRRLITDHCRCANGTLPRLGQTILETY